MEPPSPLVPEVGIRPRVRAGLFDFGIHLGVVAVAVLAARILGASVGWRDWPALALLGVAFSFLYWVVPLAFWGRTPGMSWVGLDTRTAHDQPLTFVQAVLRWAGAILTVALAGLPLLLALSGSSLSDRLSQSETRQVKRAQGW